MQRLLRHLAATATVATVAGLVAGPMSPTAQAETRAATSIAIRLADPAVKPGESTHVRGHLAIGGERSPADRLVTLEARPQDTDEFVPIGATRTGDRGGLRFEVAPAVTTRYRWRYDGATDARPSVSGVVRLLVSESAQAPRRTPTSLSIRALHRVTPSGLVDVVRGMLRSANGPLADRPVVLLSRKAGSTDPWTFERTRRSNSLGAVRFVVDPAVTTAYRLHFPGSRRLASCRSGIVRVPVRPEVTIAASPQTVTKGSGTTVSGVVTYQGAALAGATVELVARKVGVPESRMVVGVAATGDDGSVSFEAWPKEDTRYRLRVVPAEGRAGTVSAVTTVVVTTP